MPRLLLAALLLGLLAPPAFAAEPGFDLRAMRREHPGVASVILERKRVVSRPEPGVLRLALSVTRAVLDDGDRDDLTLFTEVERPGCRTPAGVRLEVTDPDGVTHVTHQDDLIRSPRGTHAQWMGPRKGLRAGALVRDVWHVDYALACFDGLAAVELALADAEEPVLLDRVESRCADCFDAARGEGVAFTDAGGHRVVELRDLAPVDGARVPKEARPAVWISTQDDPAALGRIVAKRLETARQGTANRLRAWLRSFAEDYAGTRDPLTRIVLGLSNVPVWGQDSVWTQGLGHKGLGDPGEERLLPMDWLALAMGLLEPHGGVPVLLAPEPGVPDGVALVFSWDEYGVLVPDVGLVTTDGFVPLVAGSASHLLGAELLVLEPAPTLRSFSGGAGLNRVRWDADVSPSGIASLLVDVDYTATSSWAAESNTSWEVSSARARKKRKKDFDEGQAARDFVSRFLLDDRPVATATVLEPEGHSLHVRTAWTERDVLLRADDLVLVPVAIPGLPTWIQPLDRDRTLPIDLGVRELSGRVRVQPPKGRGFAGLPPSLEIDEDPLRFVATWVREGDAAVLEWTLLVEAPILPAELTPTLNRVAAAVDQLARATLVAE